MIALYIIFCAWLNRWRGGGWPGHIWGGPAIVPSAVLALVTALCVWWPIGIIAGLGFMFWAIWGWSPYITMQRSQNAPLVGVPWIDHIVYRNGQPHTVLQDIEGWALRQVYAVPLFAAAAIVENNAALILWFFPFAVGVVGAYVVAWRLWYPGRWGIDPTGLSECLTGAIWGTSILAVSHGL